MYVISVHDFLSRNAKLLRTMYNIEFSDRRIILGVLREKKTTNLVDLNIKCHAEFVFFITIFYYIRSFLQLDEFIIWSPTNVFTA